MIVPTLHSLKNLRYFCVLPSGHFTLFQKIFENDLIRQVTLSQLSFRNMQFAFEPKFFRTEYSATKKKFFVVQAK